MLQPNQADMKQKGKVPFSSAFCSIQDLNRLDNAHPHWGGRSTLLSPPVQMLISSSRNTLTDIPKKSLIWAPWPSQDDT